MPDAEREADSSLNLREKFAGLLIGTAIGDSLGLPAEGLSRSRIERLWPGEWRHRFLFRKGMISDDTEQTLFLAQALLACSNEPAAFARSLAWKVRWWLLGAPAGVGFATARATLKLWIGFPPSRSGVNSAGNGAAMRVAIIGAVFANAPPKLEAFVRASTQLTHTDARALTGALAVALAAAWSIRQREGGGREALLESLRTISDDADWQAALAKLNTALKQNWSVAEFAAGLGCANRVSGYVFHTVPVALFAWLRHWGDFRATITSAIRCGGDTDTVAAISGALAGCTVGKAGIPADWLAGMKDWPRSISVLEEVAARLAGEAPREPVRYPWPLVIPRNVLFLLVVLFHAFRRVLPPY